MTTPIPALPPVDSVDWYAHYAAMDAALREAQTLLASLAPPTGPVISINGITADGGGNVALIAGDVGALADTYAPSYADAVPNSRFNIDKDTGGTGFWPSGWDPVTHLPIYSGGAVDHSVRPSARTDLVFIWRGPEPSPDPVSSGTGGMLRGKDEREIIVP